MQARTPQEPGRSGRLLLAGRGTGDQSPGRESKPKEGTAERGKPSGKHGLGRGGHPEVGVNEVARLAENGSTWTQ